MSQRPYSRLNCKGFRILPVSQPSRHPIRNSHPNRDGTGSNPATCTNAIGHTATDLVVIDESGLLFAGDLVRNNPFLRNRPKVLDLTLLDEANLANLCARYSVTMFGRPQGLAFGILPNDAQTKFGDDVRAKKKAVMARLSCGIDMAVSANKDTRF